jgi:hypothetical protein
MFKVITVCWDAEQRDKLIRTAYCQWLLRQHISNVALVTRLLLTDEARFTRDRIFSAISRLWVENNSHARHAANHHRQFSINMWAGIIGDDRCIESAFIARWTTLCYWGILTYEHANKCGIFVMELLDTSLLMFGLFYEQQFSWTVDWTLWTTDMAT